jgi:hypothetical protein
MELTAKDIQHAVRSLWGVDLSDKEAEAWRETFPDARDLLFHLLTAPGPSAEAGGLQAVLKSLVKPVQRNCLEDAKGTEDLRFAKEALLRKLRLDLFETQKELAATMGSAKQLEVQIQQLRSRVASLAP